MYIGWGWRGRGDSRESRPDQPLRLWVQNSSGSLSPRPRTGVESLGEMQLMTKPLRRDICHVEVATGDELAISCPSRFPQIPFRTLRFRNCKIRRVSSNGWRNTASPSFVTPMLQAMRAAKAQSDVRLGKNMQTLKNRVHFQHPQSLIYQRTHTPPEPPHRSLQVFPHPLHTTAKTCFLHCRCCNRVGAPSGLPRCCCIGICSRLGRFLIHRPLLLLFFVRRMETDMVMVLQVAQGR